MKKKIAGHTFNRITLPIAGHSEPVLFITDREITSEITRDVVEHVRRVERETQYDVHTLEKINRTVAMKQAALKAAKKLRSKAA